MKDQIAYLLFRLGFKPSFSTDIGENITKGYGKLDDNGFWEYQVPEKDYYQIELYPFWKYSSIYRSLFSVQKVYYNTYKQERSAPKVISAKMLLEFPKIKR